MVKVFLLVVIVFTSGISYVSGQIKIGVALPLMKNSGNEEEQKMGEQMLKGINDALNEYDSTKRAGKIIIKIEDTQKDQSIALNVFNKFGSDTGFIAVFGPVYSSELVNNAGAAAFHKIPIITPTATYNFLAEKNEYIFQLNPTYDVRGKVMAKFAMSELGMKNFIILSEESYGKNFEESFTFEVNKNGGSIGFTKFYSKKNNLSEELEEIRNKLFEKEKFIDFGNLNKSQEDKLKNVRFRFSYADSLINEKLVVSIYRLFGKNAEKTLDSLGLTYTTVYDKSRNYILGLTDAVYIPISNSNEISSIVSQYFSEKIPLPILGTSDWNNEEDLKANSDFIKELYFDSDFYLKSGINEKLTSDMDESEIKNYYFGYDGMKLILDKISEGNKTRQSLYDALQKVNEYEAMHNNVTIKSRTNSEMSIMIFKTGILNKLKNYVL